MKPLKLLLFIAGVACWLTACDEPHDLNFNREESSTDLKFQAKSSKQVEVPFKANLSTSQAEDALSEICSFTSPNDFWALEHQVGGGKGTFIGLFRVDLKFCFHIVLDDQGFPDLENGFGQFNRAEGEETKPIIEARNGDRLYAEVHENSRLIPIQNEKYYFEFNNVWHITGGTGRFKNATGQFTGYGLVRSDGTGTDHTWEGTIILK